METEKIILLASLWCLIEFLCFSGYQQVTSNYLISAVCGNALVKVARTIPLAAKSCELFSSSVAKDFFAVTLRQP